MRRFFALERRTMPGKKISRANMVRVQQIADHAIALGAKHPGMLEYSKADMSLSDQQSAVAQAVFAMVQVQSDQYPYIEDVYDTHVIIAIADTYYRADYTIADGGAVTLAARDSWLEVEEVWMPVQQAAKAGLLDLDVSTATPYASMKAVGDRLIEVKVAYYGHKGGKDSHQEYFDSRTDFDPENFPTPPLLYYHGFDANGKKMGKPAVTGKFESRRSGTDGHYLTYKLKATKYADLQWEAAQKGQCVVSPGTIGHLIRKAADGHLDYWPLAEVSAWDYAANRAPANLHSVAAPVVKALYISEGIAPPSVLDTAASETPKAPGDGASEQAHSGGDTLSSDEVARYVVTQVASAVLSKNMRTPTP
jgi:hypothetical protein